eukprot:scaffold3342_cov186-Alexandrium_tamarense.AAC.11
MDHFDPTTIGRDLGTNWALKTSNLRKLLRNLEEFYTESLLKSADFESVSEQIPSIAKDGNEEGIMSIVELIAAAAVTCEDKGVFVERIMEMEQQNAVELQTILQDVLGRLTDVDEGGEDEGEEDDDSLNFGSPEPADMSAASPQVLFASHGGGEDSEIVKERDELRSSLADARRELAAVKSKAKLQEEDDEADKKKLRSLLDDAQSRLSEVENNLFTQEQEATQKARELRECETKINDLEEKCATLDDELDVAKDKASRLAKAEATVAAYRKKLENMGAMDQDVKNMADQTEGYLRKIMELEKENNKIPALQRSLEEAQSQAKKSEARCATAEESLKSKDNEITKLRNDAFTAEKAKKMYQEELTELRAQHASADEVSSPMANLSVGISDGLSEAKEKAMRLEIENSDLKTQLEQLQTQGTVNAAAVSGDVPEAVAALEKQLNDKNAEVTKLMNDKEKLEAYTKKTLQKFQEKYLVALQDCKAKLKEKHDKIEALEMRSANEKVAQKREERLLSSAIYELGLGMMQTRLGKH